ncbi:DUF3261 domain-containing protein [Desulfonatronum thiodismutans]|uniref:DUF3261 domain-containing protein n=1 Tax=Desulfonatronum thiodismutans TaxID=159290 RepID=UPI0004ABD9F5|nr:DUF3261 domain-containing protein [Desulfonatronum thiodismutans]
MHPAIMLFDILFLKAGRCKYWIEKRPLLLILLALLSIFAGCAKPYTPPANFSPLPSGTHITCAHPFSALEAGTLHLRQTVIWKAGERVQVMQGIMLLDGQRKQVRLLGLSEIGIKLFDLTVGGDVHEVHLLAPVLGPARELLARQVAQSVRRVFLTYPEMETAQAFVGPGSVILADHTGDGNLVLECSPPGEPVRRVWSPDQRWEIDLDDYSLMNDITLPGRIVYQDHRAGYVLTIILHEVFEP